MKYSVQSLVSDLKGNNSTTDPIESRYVGGSESRAYIPKDSVP